MDTNTLIAISAIFVLRILGLGLATLRTLLMVRGQKLWSTLISLFEFSTYAVSLGWVVQDLTNIWNILAYAGGSAAGIWLGMFIEQRFIIGFITINIISKEKAHEIAEAVRAAGFGATEGVGHGANGAVGTVRIVARRQEINTITKAINSVENNAFITVEETRSLRHGYLRRGHY